MKQWKALLGGGNGQFRKVSGIVVKRTRSSGGKWFAEASSSFYTLLLVRVGGRRIFGKITSFDIVLGVILGSIMSRAITANAKFIPTLAAATALVLLHWLLSIIAQHSKTFGHLIKGTEVLMIKDGKIQQDALKQTHMTEHDLMESLRSLGGTDEIKNVRAAYLERSGQLSVIKE